MADDNKSTPHTLNQRVVFFALGNLRKKVGRGECWDLAELALKKAGAQTSSDLGPVGDDTDYVWGDLIDIKDVIPGDVLQFRDHEVTTTTVTESIFPDGSSVTQSEEITAIRPHHTAIVNGKLDGNGAVATLEQHVKPLGEVVQNKSLYTRSASLPPTQSVESQLNPVTKKRETAKVTRTVTISVKGKIWAYRPQSK